MEDLFCEPTFQRDKLCALLLFHFFKFPMRLHHVIIDFRYFFDKENGRIYQFDGRKTMLIIMHLGRFCNKKKSKMKKYGEKRN